MERKDIRLIILRVTKMKRGNMMDSGDSFGGYQSGVSLNRVR